MFNPLSIVGKLPAPVMVLMTSALIGTAVFASASTLDITGGTVQSGTYDELSCDPKGAFEISPLLSIVIHNSATDDVSRFGLLGTLLTLAQYRA